MASKRSGNAQGRQKSCSACAKAKRRCDLRQPHCRRCVKQKLTCAYPAPPPSLIFSTPSSFAVSQKSTRLQMNDEATDLSTALDFDFDVADVEASSITPSPWDVDCQFSQPLELRNDLFPEDALAAMDLPLTRPLNAKATPFFTLSAFVEARIGYTLEQLRATPRMMVEQNATHWCHPLLYEESMPRCLQDAHAACALYISRNETNNTFILRHIADRAHELTEQVEPTDTVHTLARAQALLLYQIMLICSNDVRSFSQAERLAPHVQMSGTALIQLQSVDPEELSPSLPIFPSNAARSAWTNFIFRESCRRTLLTIYHTVATSTALFGQVVECTHELAFGNRITVSAALWRAQSPFDFAMAWNQRKHVLVKDLDLKELLQRAEADTMDTFACMLIIGIMGIDDVKGWLHLRGGNLKNIC